MAKTIYTDYLFIVPGHTTYLVLRHYTFARGEKSWGFFYQHKARDKSTYDGWAKTPEEAWDLFWRHGILKLPQAQAPSWHYGEEVERS